MAVLPPTATYAEFCDYVVDLKGPKSDAELADLWAWRQKVVGVKFDTGRGARGALPPDEQDLTMNQREQKVIAEAQAQGRNIEPVGKRWV